MKHISRFKIFSKNLDESSINESNTSDIIQTVKDILLPISDMGYGDIFLRSYPDGSGLWGVEFEFELDKFPDVKSAGDLDNVTNYFTKCKNISEDIASTIGRLGNDYRIGLEQSLTKKGMTGVTLEECSY